MTGEQKVIKELKGKSPALPAKIASGMILPNHSGIPEKTNTKELRFYGGTNKIYRFKNKDLVAGFPYLFLESSTDGGSNWTILAIFDSSGSAMATNLDMQASMLTARDHGTAATDEVVNVCYGTGDPPTASTTTEGTLFVKYTA